MDPICAIARRRGLFVIEDACQAHGATYKGRMAGSLADTGCFSFYPGKNLGAMGEAGAVVTNNPELLQKMQMLRDHGQARKYCHDAIGWNARMDGIQAAVLQIKLKHLDAGNDARRAHAAHYNRLLAREDQVITPTEAAYAKHVYHVYAVRVAERDRVLKAMGERGIACGIHYPIPVHLQKAYASLGCGEGSFPVAEKCAREFLSLPMFPQLTGEQVALACHELEAVLATEVEPSLKPA
jgi:dTDP-4-amino-4,6-dideoxygalactose transaminase